MCGRVGKKFNLVELILLRDKEDESVEGNEEQGGKTSMIARFRFNEVVGEINERCCACLG